MHGQKRGFKRHTLENMLGSSIILRAIGTEEIASQYENTQQGRKTPSENRATTGLFLIFFVFAQ